MKPFEFLSNSAEETLDFGARLAGHLKKGDIVCLFGDLGSGKTTLTKGIARGLHIKQEAVSSPTFILMNVYEGRLNLFHFDLYRIDDPKELFNIGYEEYLYGEGVSVVEWAQKLGALLPEECIKVELARKDENQRLIRLAAESKRGGQILSRLKK